MACVTSTSITLDLDEHRSSAILDAGVTPSRSSTYVGAYECVDLLLSDEDARVCDCAGLWGRVSGRRVSGDVAWRRRLARISDL